MKDHESAVGQDTGKPQISPLGTVPVSDSAPPAPPTSLPEEPKGQYAANYTGPWRAYAETLYSLLAQREERIRDLEKLINTPEINSFLKGVQVEAAHQIERWGTAHDRDKSAENWFWLIGYLAGKALRSAITGDRDKALHHTISSAAALFNWHRAIQQDHTAIGIGQDIYLSPNERAEAAECGREGK